jgi:hypothetical protein
MIRPIVLLAVLLAACSQDYPFDKKGTWSLDHYGGANDANLRAMLANPHDLNGGTGDPNSLASEAAPPVHRLLTDTRKELPKSDVIQVELTGPNEPNAQPQSNNP